MGTFGSIIPQLGPTTPGCLEMFCTYLSGRLWHWGDLWRHPRPVDAIAKKNKNEKHKQQVKRLVAHSTPTLFYFLFTWSCDHGFDVQTFLLKSHRFVSEWPRKSATPSVSLPEFSCILADETFPLASLISLFSSFWIQGRSAHLKAQFIPQPQLEGGLSPLSPPPLSTRKGFFWRAGSSAWLWQHECWDLSFTCSGGRDWRRAEMTNLPLLWRRVNVRGERVSWVGGRDPDQFVVSPGSCGRMGGHGKRLRWLSPERPSRPLWHTEWIWSRCWKRNLD